MIEILIGGLLQFESPETNVVECFVVDAVGLICVFDKLVNGQGGVVGLNDDFGYFGGRDHAERHHDPVRKLFADFGDEKSAHSRPSSTTFFRENEFIEFRIMGETCS